MQKYIMTDETKKIGGRTLHRIRATRDFDLVSGATVKAGDIGGWIEDYHNLDQDGNAWVSGNARVYGYARVSGNALVSGDAGVLSYARVSGNARVCEDAFLHGHACVQGNAWVYGYARVYGDACVHGNARVHGDACVHGDAWVYNGDHTLVVGPIGSRGAFTTFYRTKANRIAVACGCFSGDLDEFLRAVDITHGDNNHAKAYRAAAELAKVAIDLSGNTEGNTEN